MFPKTTECLRIAAGADAWAATRNAIREVDHSNELFPQYYEKALGAYVWDLDGNRYLDFVLGYGPVILGHADERVNDAVYRRLSLGVCASPMWSPLQVELTEHLTNLIPGAELCYLLRTGSDATSAAVRLARIYTGRKRILKWGYNGWHDWTAPRPAGIPPEVTSLTESFTYNDLASVEEAFARWPDEIACVIMMPYELERPSAAFLEGVKSIAHRNGALFILDEMRSGFRISHGGAQEFFNVTADLATFSKAMANGFPISAITGRHDVLMCMAQSHMSSTFFANPAEMAAALTTLQILRDEKVSETVWRLSDRFFNGLKQALSASGAAARLQGLPISPFLDFNASGDADHNRHKKLFYEYALRQGILLHPNHQWYLSASHTNDSVDYAVDVCHAALVHAYQN